MSQIDLTGQHIQDTYPRLLQIYSGSIYDGTGNIVNLPAATSTSSSYAETASYALYSVSASYEINYETSSSYADTAVSASYADTAVSTSYADTALYALTYNETDPLFTSVSGTFITTTSFDTFTSQYYGDSGSFSLNIATLQTDFYALSGSYRTGSFDGNLTGTASWAENSISSSHAVTASYLNPLNQNVTLNGNLTINGTASINVLYVEYQTSSVSYSSGSNQFGDSAADTQTLFGTVKVSGSLQGTGSIIFTGTDTGSQNRLQLDLDGSGKTIGLYLWDPATIRWGIRTYNDALRLPNTMFLGDTSVIINRFTPATGPAGQYGLAIQPYTDVLIRSQLGTKTFLYGQQSTGNVGIGTNSPLYTLDVSGSGNYRSGVTVTGSLTVTGSGTFIGNQVVSGTYIIDVSSSINALRVTQRGSGNAIVVEDSANPDLSPFIVNTAGKVGMGVATPVSGNLHVFDTSGTDTIMYFDSEAANTRLTAAANTSGKIPSVTLFDRTVGDFFNNSNSGSFSIYLDRASPALYASRNDAIFINNNINKGIYFLTNNNGVRGIRMVVSGSGDVGIGTNTPQTRLDVSGSGRFTNTTYISGGLLIANNSTTASVLFSVKNSANATAFTMLDSDLKARFYGGGGINYPTITSTANTNNGIGFDATQISLFTSGSRKLTATPTGIQISGSNLNIDSGITTKTTRVTSSAYTASASDYRIGVRYTATGPVTIQLPSISAVGRLDYKFKDEGGNASLNNITIVASGGDLIDGSSTAVLNQNYIARGLYNDGVSNWYIE